MKYRLWEMDTKGNAWLRAESSSIVVVMRRFVPALQAMSKRRRFLFVQAICPLTRGTKFSYPWNWASGRRLPPGDLRVAVRRMLRQKRGRGI